MSNDIKIDFSGLYNQDPTNLKIFDNDYLNNAEKYANIGKSDYAAIYSDVKNNDALRDDLGWT